MKKEEKKIRELFLEELNVFDDREEVAAKIGIKPSEKKTSWVGSLFSPKYRKFTVATCSLVLILLISLVTVFGVISYKNVPTYLGMEATNDNQERLNKQRKMSHLSNIAIDEFKEEVIGDIGVDLEEGISCYASPSEEIIITIKINNPKFYEILSFTLNSTKYQSFEFVEGSNSEQILVKFTCQEYSGLQKVTIDEIKYVDGSTIKNVRFDGDRDIALGITYLNTPQVSEISELIGTTEFGVSFVVEDKDSIINQENGLYMYLFDEEKLVQRSKVTLGKNIIPYSNLKMSCEYTYLIVGTYDLYDGSGKKGYVLYENTFKTEAGIEYSNVESDYDSVSVELFESESSSKANLAIIETNIYKDDVLINTVPESSSSVFTGLLSNTEYTIVTKFKYIIIENNTEVIVNDEIVYTIKTEERPIPTIEIINVAPGKTSVEFEYVINDTTGAGKVIKEEIIKEDISVQVLEGSIMKFENLLSNNEYKIIATYSYDLLDGNGTQTITTETVFATSAKTEPIVTIDNVTTSQKTIGFEINVEDVDNTYTVKAIELWKDNSMVKEIELNAEKVFTELLSNNEYEIKVIYEYDLNDGNGPITDEASYIAKTNEVTVPVATFTSAIGFNTSLTAWIEILDIDNVINIVQVDLYKDNVICKTTNTLNNYRTTTTPGKSKADVTFNGLESGSYTFVIVYTYDLNDGKGTQTVDENFKTIDPNSDNTIAADL